MSKQVEFNTVCTGVWDDRFEEMAQPNWQQMERLD